MSARPRPGLTRKTLIDTALRLLDEVGLDGLTVRRLAAEFNVQSSALYWHIRTKQELLDGMADSIILAAGMGPPRNGEPWQDWLARRARAARRSMLAHRDGALVVATASWLSPATIKAFNEELSALTALGFTPQQALRTISAVSRYVTGYVLQEQARSRASTAGPADPYATLLDLLDGDASAPLLVALRDNVEDAHEDSFEFGLGAFIDGAAAALAKNSA